jgi:hypothetical protein
MFKINAKLLVLNWKPTWAGFGTTQGDLFVGIDHSLNVIPADKCEPELPKSLI